MSAPLATLHEEWDGPVAVVRLERARSMPRTSI